MWIGPVLSPHTISAVCAARANGLCISMSNLSSISCMQAAMLKDKNTDCAIRQDEQYGTWCSAQHVSQVSGRCLLTVTRVVSA